MDRMHIKRRIVGILSTTVLTCLLLGGCGKTEEPDPKLEPAGVTINGEELNGYGVEAYNNTLKYMFEDSNEAAGVLFADGYTVKMGNHIPIVLKPEIKDNKETKDIDESEGFLPGVYDFEKSLQRRNIEENYDIHYTGNISNDMMNVLKLFTGTDKGSKKEEPDLDPADAPSIEGLNAFSSVNASAIAITDSVKFDKGVLSINFHTLDISDPDGEKQKAAETAGEAWISPSGYNESAAAYTYCEEAIGYILLFPEYLNDITEISIKGDNYAAMHYNTDTITCTYGMTGGALYETWKGYLCEGDIDPVYQTVTLPADIYRGTKDDTPTPDDTVQEPSNTDEGTITNASESSEEFELASVEENEKPVEGTDIFQMMGAAGIASIIISVLIWLVNIVANWKIYSKTGLPGWVSLIPLLNIWALFEFVWGNGKKVLLMLIPFFNIYFGFKTCIKMAKVFGKGTGFGIGLIFLSPIFIPILAFSNTEYDPEAV